MKKEGKRRALAAVVCGAMLTVALVGGTFAYLTDRDSAANVFTVGDVAIELTEDFEQGAELMPGVNLEKEPIITNTGKSDAWVWLEFAIPSALDNWSTDGQEGSNANVIHWNQLGATTDGYVTETRVQNSFDQGYLTEDMFPAGTTNYVECITANNMTWNLGGKTEFSRQETINGIGYNVYVIGYNKALEPGESTLPNIYKVFLDAQVDVDANGDWYRVVDGNATKIEWNSGTNGNPTIYVNAYAIQKDQFANVDEAIEAYVGQWGEFNAEWGTPATVVDSAGSLASAAEAGEYVVMTEDVTAPLASSAIYGTPVAVIQKNGGVIDGGGNSLDIENPQYNGYAIETYGGTIKNLTIDSTVGRGIVISSPKEDACIDNVVIDGPGYAINTTEHNGKNLIVSNSTVKGWTSFAGLDSATWTNCTFGENTSKYWQNMGYDQDYDRLIRPYVNTEFAGCTFEQGFYIDLSALGEDCIVTLSSCKANDGTVLTAENYGPYITIELPSGRTLADCVVFK